MSILISVEIAFTLTCLTGSCCYWVWKKFAEKYSEYRSLIHRFYMLRMTLLFFVFPVSYYAVYMWYESTNGIHGTFLEITPALSTIAIILACIWGIGAIRMLCMIIKDLSLELNIRKTFKSVDEREASLLKEICKDMGIHRRIRLFKGEMALSPSIGGTFFPKIYLNEQPYNPEDLKLIFRHELLHYRHRDIWIQYLLIILQVLYWFNPVFYKRKIHTDIRKTSDDYCDYVIMRTENMNHYIAMLLKVAIQGEESVAYMRSFICETQHDVMRRIECMENYKKAKEIKRVSAVFWTIIFVLTGSMTAYAAGTGIALGYEVLYDETVIEVEEQVQSAETLTEYIEAAGVDDGTIIEEVAIDADSRSSMVVIDWTVRSGVQRQTDAFSMSAGDEIFVAVSIDPDDKNVQVGIIEPDGTKRYVYNCGNITHTFAINKAGSHKVFVKNTNTVSVEVLGHFTK